MMTRQFIKKIFYYNPDTGDFVWLNPPFKHKRLSGKVAGGVCDGYRIIQINRKPYKAHRLAFLYMTGDMPLYPEIEIDHINHDRLDNRWINLRKVRCKENRKNISLSKINTSGFTGVHWNKKEKKWKSQIQKNNKNIHLGYFDSKDNAIEARQKANIKYGFHENHGSKSQFNYK